MMSAAGGEEVCAVRLRVWREALDQLNMYVVGSCPQLGLWKAGQALPMKPLAWSSEDGKENMGVWECVINLPKNSSIFFRYFVGKGVTQLSSSGTRLSQDIEVIVWETNNQPRHLKTTDNDEMQLDLAEFGTYDGFHTTSHGWLENHACVQVRFHSNPIFMWKSKHRHQTYSIKCSPVDYEPGSSQPETMNWDDSTTLFTDESSLDGPPQCQRTSMAYYNLNKEDQAPASQPATGCVYNQDDYLVFLARGMNQLYLGFQVDFYVHRAHREERQFVGSSHLLPPKMELSVYSKRVPIIGLNHRPIGEVQVEILHISPLPKHDCVMDVSYQNHWKWRNVGTTLNVGHRGMGSSYKSNVETEMQRVTSAKENTIRSMYSAAQHGADFVELDVLLSSDSVPVIFHDFHVCLSTPLKKHSSRRMVRVAIKDLTLDQLHSLKIYHSSSEDVCGSDPIEITDEDDMDDQPFPTLQCCLERVDPQVGFNIEIKYPQVLETGENEEDNFFDSNHFIDTILAVVLKYAGNRKIIFSTFHADTCVMVRLKQNKYPILFLSNGPTQRYTPYKDWRCASFQHGINFAKAEGLLGVNFQAEGLLQDLALIPYIQSLGLVLFVWGEDLNEEHVRKTLRQHKVDAIIFDRIGQNHSDQFLIDPFTTSLEDVINNSPSFNGHTKDALADKESNGTPV
ncbi:hypothetical protein ACOMHN_007402 [Nucella lapillus]